MKNKKGNKPHKPNRSRGPKTSSGKPPMSHPNLRVNLWGWHACYEAWHNEKRHIQALYLSKAAAERFEPEIHKARKAGLKRPEPKIIDPKVLDGSIKGDPVHQGIAMMADNLPERDVQDLIIACENGGLVVMLDQVTDPHNVGAIIRSASAFGAKGMVMQKKHAPTLEGVLAKIACGGTEHLAVAQATNLSRAIEQFQEAGFVVVGLDERGDQDFEKAKAHEKVVLVLGAEGPGMRRLVAEHCDLLVALPTVPPILSLNVSNAAAVALYALKR